MKRPLLPLPVEHRRMRRQCQAAAPLLMSLALIVLLHSTSALTATPSHVRGISFAVLAGEGVSCDEKDIIPLYTRAQQDNTLAFLSRFPYTIPALRDKWVCRNFCHWNGVHCFPDGVEVHLDSQRLVGRLPEVPSLINADQVIMTRFVVDGEGDGIDSGLPGSWRNLDRLKSLEIRIDYRQIAPTSMSLLSTMHSQQMSSHAAVATTRPIKCQIPRNVVNLSLAHNSMSGPLPPTFPLCNPKIRYLYLNDNAGLYGPIPEEWGRWSSLQIINIKKTAVCGCPPREWASFTPPVVVEAESRVTDPVFCIVSCGSASSSSLSSSAPSSSSGSNLDCYGPVPFYTAGQQVHTRNFLESFKETIQDLQPLWFCPNFCVWVYVSCAPEGVAVEITGTEFIGYVPEVAVDVDPSEVVVTTLDFSRSTWLEGDYPASWASLAFLQKVSFAYTSLSGTLPLEWGSMPALRYLDLSFTWSGGLFPTSWGSLRNLEVLKLVQLTIADQLPDGWSGMKALRELDISNGGASGTLPRTWGALSNLENLSLHHNSIQGTLPPGWHSLARLTTLLLHNNQLTGSIPEIYGAMNSLRRVGLETNHICGCLPSEWKARLGVSMIVTAQPEVLAPDCSTANTCAPSSSSSSNGGSSSEHKSTSSASSPTTTSGPTGEPILPSSSSSFSPSQDTAFYDRLYRYCPNVVSVGVEVLDRHRHDICCSEWHGANYTTTCGNDIKNFSSAIVTCSGALGSRGFFSCCSKVNDDGVGTFLGERCEETDGRGDGAAAPLTWWRLRPAHKCVMVTLVIVIVTSFF